MTPVFAVHAPSSPGPCVPAEAGADSATDATPSNARVATPIAEIRTSFQLEGWPFRRNFMTPRSPEPRTSRPRGTEEHRVPDVSRQWETPPPNGDPTHARPLGTSRLRLRTSVGVRPTFPLSGVCGFGSTTGD